MRPRVLWLLGIGFLATGLSAQEASYPEIRSLTATRDPLFQQQQHDLEQDLQQSLRLHRR